MHALFAADCQAEDKRSAEQNGPGSQRDRLEHVRPAPDAAIEEDRRPIADGIGDRGQCVEGRDRPVKLAAAMVGDDHAGRTLIDRLSRIIGMKDALDDDRQPCRPAEPSQVVPGARGIGEDLAEILESSNGIGSRVAADGLLENRDR